jgi:drug/metabolite transporter (DMT)-like permease
MSTPRPSGKQIKPVLATGMGILFVSTASLLIRYAQRDASSLVIAAGRLLVASLILLPIVLIGHRHEFKQLSRKSLGKGILSGLFLAIHFVSWIKSLEYTSVASSVVLVTTTPLWVALLSPLVLKEPVRKPVIIGLVVSIAGGIIVGLSNACGFMEGRLICHSQAFSSMAMLGNLLALVGAWTAAGYMMIGRQLRKQLSTVSYAALVYGVAALLLLVVVIIRAEPVFSYQPETYLWLLALGIIPQLLGHSLLNWSLEFISAAYVSLTLLGEPIGTIILAMIFLKENPTILEVVGAVLILVGIVIGSLRESTRPSGA